MNANDTVTVKGRCLCGAVTYEAEVDPLVHICHCDMCRRWAGGPAMAVRSSEVRFAGAENLQRYESSAWAYRGFCGTCGSNLFYQLREGVQPTRGRYVMWAGAMEEASVAALGMRGEIYIDEKPDFYALTGEHERITGAEFVARIMRQRGADGAAAGRPAGDGAATAGAANPSTAAEG